jgi:hypothetical protein
MGVKKPSSMHTKYQLGGHPAPLARSPLLFFFFFFFFFFPFPGPSFLFHKISLSDRVSSAAMGAGGAENEEKEIIKKLYIPFLLLHCLNPRSLPFGWPKPPCKSNYAAED